MIADQLGLAEPGAHIGLDAALLENLDRGRAQLIGDQDLRHSEAPPRRRCSRERPVEPWQERLEVGRLDRRAAPQPEARRRVAVAGDVVGDALGLEPRGQPLDEAGLARRRQRRNRRIGDLRGRSRSRNGSPGAGRGTRPRASARPSPRSARDWPRRARSARRGRRSARPRRARRARPRRKHRGRVDRLAAEHALDQLALGRQAQDLRQRPAAARSSRAARRRAATAPACRAAPRRPAPSARTRW